MNTNNLPFDEQYEMDFINAQNNAVADTAAVVEKDIYDSYNF